MGFDDCGNSTKYTRSSYNFMKSTNEVLMWTDEEWFNNKYGYLDENRYYVEDNSDINSPQFCKKCRHQVKYPRGTGTCFIINN